MNWVSLLFSPITIVGCKSFLGISNHQYQYTDNMDIIFSIDCITLLVRNGTCPEHWLQRCRIALETKLITTSWFVYVGLSCLLHINVQCCRSISSSYTKCQWASALRPTGTHYDLLAQGLNGSLALHRHGAKLTVKFPWEFIQLYEYNLLHALAKIFHKNFT